MPDNTSARSADIIPLGDVDGGKPDASNRLAFYAVLCVRIIWCFLGFMEGCFVMRLSVCVMDNGRCFVIVFGALPNFY